MDMFIPGTYGNGALLAQVVLTRAVSFSDEFAGARAYAGVTATAETDHAIIAVYTALDDASELWDLIPMMEFLIENAADPNRISFLVAGVYRFGVGVRRSGSTDTITSADLSLRKDGVKA